MSEPAHSLQAGAEARGVASHLLGADEGLALVGELWQLPADAEGGGGTALGIGAPASWLAATS
jgi:hypothetical protein